MKINSMQAEEAALLAIAQAMAAAARTAPKAKGTDHISSLILTGVDRLPLIAAMREMAESLGRPFLARDAGNLEASPAILLLGVKGGYRGFDPCGNCGYANCLESEAVHGTCVYGPVDLGIALGFAAGAAMDHRADFRIFHSAGIAAKALGLLPEAFMIVGIPISAHGKDIYHDRP